MPVQVWIAAFAAVAAGAFVLGVRYLLSRAGQPTTTFSAPRYFVGAWTGLVIAALIFSRTPGSTALGVLGAVTVVNGIILRLHARQLGDRLSEMARRVSERWSLAMITAGSVILVLAATGIWRS